MSANYFFTADMHIDHERIIHYCQRPFKSLDEQIETLISNFNSLVSAQDIVVHAGDFCLSDNAAFVNKTFVNRLNGHWIFLKGSHDKWLSGTHAHEIWEKKIGAEYVVVCHYAMRVWARSHYNSWQLYGHSHGKLPPMGKQLDIGVDNNSFYPFSWEQVKNIMATRPDNPNLIQRRAQ